jgi:hypothetical protein
MSPEQRAAVGEAVAIGINLIAVVANLWARSYGVAGLSAGMLVVIPAWAWLRVKIAANLDAHTRLLTARIGDATTECRMRELALSVMEQHVREGHASATVKGAADWPH